MYLIYLKIGLTAHFLNAAVSPRGTPATQVTRIWERSQETGISLHIAAEFLT
jgi:hypothetical protein